jgi:hypothetical protein
LLGKVIDMSPNEAIAYIERVREQVARIEMFRAFRAITTAMTGVLAIAGGLVQAIWQLNDPNSFMVLWFAIALMGVALVGIEMAIRYRTADSLLAQDAMMAAVKQFQPCLIAGGLITLGIGLATPHAMLLLPALWAFCFGLGIFAVRPGLPDAARFIGAWYLLSGMVLIALAGRSIAFSPWWMPVTFGFGQLFSAGVLAMAERGKRATGE